MRIEGINLPGISNLSGRNLRIEQDNSFADILKQSMADVQNLEATNRQNNYLLASGGMENLHGVMIDTEKADIALQFTLQVRNRIMEAYHEIMRMQL